MSDDTTHCGRCGATILTRRALFSEHGLLCHACVANDEAIEAVARQIEEAARRRGRDEPFAQVHLGDVVASCPYTPQELQGAGFPRAARLVAFHHRPLAARRFPLVWSIATSLMDGWAWVVRRWRLRRSATR